MSLNLFCFLLQEHQLSAWWISLLYKAVWLSLITFSFLFFFSICFSVFSRLSLVSLPWFQQGSACSYFGILKLTIISEMVFPLPHISWDWTAPFHLFCCIIIPSTVSYNLFWSLIAFFFFFLFLRLRGKKRVHCLASRSNSSEIHSLRAFYLLLCCDPGLEL